MKLLLEYDTYEYIDPLGGIVPEGEVPLCGEAMLREVEAAQLVPLARARDSNL